MRIGKQMFAPLLDGGRRLPDPLDPTVIFSLINEEKPIRNAVRSNKRNT
jgi:hypothetical protein